VTSDSRDPPLEVAIFYQIGERVKGKVDKEVSKYCTIILKLRR
jgi:hypothetical protein